MKDNKIYYVRKISNTAFYNCEKLTSIEIPYTVNSIPLTPFSGCSALSEIIVKSGNGVYDSRNNCNAIINTATNTLTKSTVETGATVMVPLFCKEGDKIIVDTRDGSYVQRVKE